MYYTFEKKTRIQIFGKIIYFEKFLKFNFSPSLNVVISWPSDTPPTCLSIAIKDHTLGACLLDPQILPVRSGRQCLNLNALVKRSWIPIIDKFTLKWTLEFAAQFWFDGKCMVKRIVRTSVYEWCGWVQTILTMGSRWCKVNVIVRKGYVLIGFRRFAIDWFGLRTFTKICLRVVGGAGWALEKLQGKSYVLADVVLRRIIWI